MAVTYLQFNGNDYMSIANSATLSPEVDDFTITCWFRTTNDFSGGTGSIYSNSGTAGVTGGRYRTEISINTDNKLMGYYGGTESENNDTNPGSLYGYSNKEVTDGDWHFCCWVKDGVFAKLYIDGELNDSDQDTQCIWIQVNKNDTPKIGRDAPFSSEFYTGDIYEIKIYNDVALDQEQVYKLYQEDVGKFEDASSSSSSEV